MEDETDPEIVQFLSGHDMPCDGCGYNLRGMEGLVCPECGVRQPYEDFTRMVEYRKRHEILEVGEFRFVRQAGSLLSILLLIDALMMGFGGLVMGAPSDWYWVILIALFGGALLNTAVLLVLFYTKHQYTTAFWSPRADRRRDQYGVLVMVAIVPAGAFIGLLLMGVL